MSDSPDGTGTVERSQRLHTGEIELRGDDIGGIAVHLAERVVVSPVRVRCSSRER